MHAELPHPLPGPDVPVRYRGIWRRSLLETEGGVDTATTVFWLQGAHWHADIRIPSGRPDFAGVDGIDDCTDAHLAWLATQAGFAGVTSVRADARGELCSWRRIVDYGPPQDQPDAGWMRFDADRLVETGAHARYLEHWYPVPDTAAPLTVLRAVDSGHAPAELLFLAGRYAMHVRWPRRAAGAPAGPWFERELSFAQRSSDGLVIAHSTMPWMEGRERALRMLACDGRFAELDCDGQVRTWRVLESCGADAWDLRPGGD
jgi:hypothetical protein